MEKEGTVWLDIPLDVQGSMQVGKTTLRGWETGRNFRNKKKMKRDLQQTGTQNIAAIQIPWPSRPVLRWELDLSFRGTGRI